ncbi:hypothetical protein H4R35_003313 [Dimargaris xerosporica]|nr:hypothetical protein H4R35_003313 [Dimargaris xerosporica]
MQAPPAPIASGPPNSIVDAAPPADAPMCESGQDDEAKGAWLQEELQALGELKREALSSQFPEDFQLSDEAANVWVPAHLHPEIAPSEFRAWIKEHGTVLNTMEKRLSRRRSVLSLHSYSRSDLESEGPVDTSADDGQPGDDTAMEPRQLTAVIRRRNTTDSAFKATPVSSFSDSFANHSNSNDDGTWVIQNIQRSGLKRSKRTNLRRDSVLSEGSRRRRQMRKAAARGQQSGDASLAVPDDTGTVALSSNTEPVSASEPSTTLQGILSEITAKIDALGSSTDEVPVPVPDHAEASPFTVMTGVLAPKVSTAASLDPLLTSPAGGKPLDTPSTPIKSTDSLGQDLPVPLKPPPPPTPALTHPISRPGSAKDGPASAPASKKSSPWSWLWGSDSDANTQSGVGPDRTKRRPSSDPADPHLSNHHVAIINSFDSSSSGGSPTHTPPNSLSKAAQKPKRASPISLLFSKTKQKFSSSDSHGPSRKSSFSEDAVSDSDGETMHASLVPKPSLTDPLGTASPPDANFNALNPPQFIKDIAAPRPPVRYTNYNRYPIHIERAIYRLSHIKLANPRRPLLHQVLISNMMFWYLSIINPRTNSPMDYYNQSPGDPPEPSQPYEGGGDPSSPNSNGPLGLVPNSNGAGDYYDNAATGLDYSAYGAPNGDDYSHSAKGSPGDHGNSSYTYSYPASQGPSFSPTASTPHDIPPSLTPGGSSHTGSGHDSRSSGDRKSGKKKGHKKNRQRGPGSGKHGGKPSAEMAIGNPQYGRQKQRIYQHNAPPGGAGSAPYYGPPAGHHRPGSPSHSGLGPSSYAHPSPRPSIVTQFASDDEDDDVPLAMYTTDVRKLST